MSRKILIVLRHDAEAKAGGDVTLMTEFSVSLSDYGLDCDLVVGVPDSLHGYSLAICANLDRPIEAARLLEKCSKANVPVQLMTLHHSHEAVSDFLRFGLSGWKRFIARLAGYDPVSYELYLWYARVLFSFLVKGQSLPFGLVRAAQLKLIDGCHSILVVSPAELNQIERDIGIVRSRVIYLPHIINSADTNFRFESKRDVVFCPGRIESRKNQLFLLSVAEVLPNYEFVFMGAPNKSETAYVGDFLKKVSELPNVKFLSPRGLNEFKEYLISADVVLTASWFEVTSLIELEVLACSKKLVTASRSYNDSFFNNSLKFQFNDVESCKNTIIRAVSSSNIDRVVTGEYPSRDDILCSYIDEVTEIL
jgi:glycosyltransferase involved in cell wall biosynthesis